MAGFEPGTFPQSCGTRYRAPLHPRNKKSQQVFRWLSLFLLLNKSGWQDSNLGPSRNSAGRDTGLRYTPEIKKANKYLLAFFVFDLK